MRISGYVSVIVPMHQGALTITRCLEAIAAQTYRPLEVVLVDDGSTDPGPAWVRAFRRAHPEVSVHVVTQAQAGPGAALNAGLARARGEFVAFAHQADAWHPEKLAVQVAQLQAAPAAGFSLAGVLERVGGKEARMPAPAIGAGLLYEPLCLSSLVARAAAVEAVGGFDPAPGLAAAHDLAVRMFQRGPGVRLPALVAVCHRPAGAELPVGALEATLTKLTAEGRLTRWQLRWGQSRLHTRAGWRALVADDPHAAAGAFKLAIQANPWRADSWIGLGFSWLDRGLFRLGLLTPAKPAPTPTGQGPAA